MKLKLANVFQNYQEGTDIQIKWNRVQTNIISSGKHDKFSFHINGHQQFS